MSVMGSADVESLIFGSGFDTYEWWIGAEVMGPAGWDGIGEAPEGWAWDVTVEDETGEGERVVRVRYENIVGACRRIVADEDVKVTAETYEEAGLILVGVDDSGVDANIADQILQVAVFGHVIYG